MLALSLPAATREAQHGFTRPKREHGSRTPRPRTVAPTADRSQNGNNDFSATEMEMGLACYGIIVYGQNPRFSKTHNEGNHSRCKALCTHCLAKFLL